MCDTHVRSNGLRKSVKYLCVEIGEQMSGEDDSAVPQQKIAETETL